MTSATAESIRPAPPLVALDGVGRRFPDGTVALDRVDLAVRAGEVLSLVGPSGCGKSTVLRLLAGLDRPNAGRIAWAAGRPEIGFVFQDATLMPWATAADNVFLPLRLRGLGAATPPRGSPKRWSASAWRASPAIARRSCPAACACGCRSPERWWCGRRCC